MFDLEVVLLRSPRHKIDSCELNRIVMRKGEIEGFMSFYTALYVEGNC